MDKELKTFRLDPERATWRRVDEELVVLDLQESAYLAINATGTAIWPLLEKGACNSELVDAILEEFDIDRESAIADVDAFISELQSRRILHD